MKRKLTLLGCLAALLLVPARAQVPEEYARFRDEAGEASVLYRGRQATKYTMAYNGNPYWDSPEFRVGSVTFNEKAYEGILMNIDAWEQQVLVKAGSNLPAIVLSRDEVPEFTIDGVRWINPQAMGIDAPEGFFEVLADRGSVLALRRVNKRMKQSTDNKNGKSIGYTDPNYRMNVINYFAYSEGFYLLQDGKCAKAGRHKVMRYVNEGN